MTALCPNSEKASELRKLLTRRGVDCLLEAHSGLSARIVEEAGFPGIWGSSLSISASLGVRDANEMSWTQVLDVVEFMCDATRIPILLDADTGYGNFNNVRRFVRKAERIGVAGLCIEDKVFPKVNSLVDSPAEALASVDEFCGRIRAGADSRTNPDTVLVARTEALVAGLPVDEALRRAEAYREAGADAILPHCKSPSPEPVLEFLEAWKDDTPIVIVPTTYSDTPTRVFEEAGASLIIWANHTLRASVTAMQEAARSIMSDGAVHGVEGDIAAVEEIFRLQRMPELREARARYLPGAAELREPGARGKAAIV